MEPLIYILVNIPKKVIWSDNTRDMHDTLKSPALNTQLRRLTTPALQRNQPTLSVFDIQAFQKWRQLKWAGFT